MRKISIEITFNNPTQQNLELAEAEVKENFTGLMTSLRNQLNNVKGSIKFEDVE